MAFDPEFETIYSEIIRPSLERAGYSVYRADSLINQQNILKDIIRNIHAANLIVAELTALNPNVFYELGIAHALRKSTVLLTQSVEELPFDLRSYRVIDYSIRFDEIGKLGEALLEVAEKAKINAITFGNPVIDFLPIDESENKQIEAVEPMSNVVSSSHTKTEEEKGLWDFVVEGEKAMQQATEIIKRLHEATQEIGEMMVSRTTEVEQIKSSGIVGSSAKMYKLVELTASEISTYSDKMESELPELHSDWETYSESVSGMIRTTKIRTPEDLAVVQQLREQLLTLSNIIIDSLNGTKEFRDSLSQFRGISKSMNRASRKAISALDKVISEFEQANSYCIKVIGLLEEKLKE
jgi:hypothetical protein